MPPDDIDPILLVRYFSGEGSETDIQDVRRWIGADSSRAVVVERMREVWRIAGEAQPEWGVEQALTAVRARGAAHVAAHVDVLPLPGRQARTANRPKAKLTLLPAVTTRWRSTAWRIAAAVAVVAGTGLVWRAQRRPVPATEAVAMRTFTTANAERATVTLPDGTHVILSPASTLRIPERFGPTGRQVSLDGEAYFEVAHDASRPFTVASGIGLTRVLGTKFSVRTRPEDDGVTVVVAEGRVSLAPRDTAAGRSAGLILGAGDLGRLTPEGSPRTIHGIDVGQYLGWTEGRLTFVDAPLPAVLTELSRWYDVEFQLGDSALARRHLTTVIRYETTTQVLAVLRASLDVRATENGRKITLYSSHH